MCWSVFDITLIHKSGPTSNLTLEWSLPLLLLIKLSISISLLVFSRFFFLTSTLIILYNKPFFKDKWFLRTLLCPQLINNPCTPTEKKKRKTLHCTCVNLLNASGPYATLLYILLAFSSSNKLFNHLFVLVILMNKSRVLSHRGIIFRPCAVISLSYCSDLTNFFDSIMCQQLFLVFVPFD